MSDQEYVISPDDLEIALSADNKVKVSGADIDGLSRGKFMAKSKFLKSIEGGFGFCNVVFGWDMLDKVYDVKEDTDTGFSDIAAHIDLSTFRRIPWENNAPFFLVDFYNPITNKPFELCPRGLLKRIVHQCNELGFKPMCGMEFEWYNFRETPDSLAQKKGVGLTPLTRGMFGYSLLRPALNQEFFDGLFEELRNFDVPLEALHTETGPGVFEAAIEYSDALRTADRAHLFKTSVKQLALKHGIISTFMAKPWPDLPGCSGHIHFSLSNITTKENAFANKEGGEGMNSISDTMRHFIAGVLEGLPSIMPFLAPTINSYKRLVENYWAPVTVSYGFENRTAALRIIAPPTCPPKGTRIEVRVPGNDVNPYLAVSAILASGIYGVKHKLEPRIPPAEGNVVSQGGARLARDLREATETMMAKDSFARKVLGHAIVDHFGATRLHEWKQWETAVTDWELKRYVETV